MASTKRLSTIIAQPLEEVHHIAHRQGVAQGAEADGFPQHQRGGEDTQPHQNIDGAVADAGDVLDAHVEDIPWGDPDAALNGQHDADGTEKQPGIEPKASLDVGKSHVLFNLLSVRPDGQNR